MKMESDEKIITETNLSALMDTLDKSYTVLICMSENYKQSPKCRFGERSYYMLNVLQGVVYFHFKETYIIVSCIISYKTSIFSEQSGKFITSLRHDSPFEKWGHIVLHLSWSVDQATSGQYLLTLYLESCQT